MQSLIEGWNWSVKSRLALKSVKYIILNFVMLGLVCHSFGQSNKNYQLGVGYSHSPDVKTFIFSFVYDNAQTRQMQTSIFYGTDFKSEIENKQYTFTGNCYFYLKKRNEKSKKLFGAISIGPVIHYRQRNYSALTLQPLNQDSKLFAIGIWPGLSLNYTFLTRFTFRSEFKYGYAYTLTYGQICTGSSLVECHEKSPYRNFEPIGSLQITLFYKIKKL